MNEVPENHRSCTMHLSTSAAKPGQLKTSLLSSIRHKSLWLIFGAGALIILLVLYLLMQLERSKVDIARTQIRILDKALQEHVRKTGAPPKRLAEVTGDPNSILLDPWGQPYQYDAAGPKNKAKKPDVFAVAPDGTVIGNWED